MTVYDLTDVQRAALGSWVTAGVVSKNGMLPEVLTRPESEFGTVYLRGKPINGNMPVDELLSLALLRRDPIKKP